MDKFVTDQAEGLRRLLARVGPRVIAVAGGRGAGRTTTVANLAAALIAVGQDVRVIDESQGDAGRASATQIDELRHSTADVVLIDAQLDEDGALSPLALCAHDVLVVTRIDAHAITVAYACVKRLHFAHAIGQFRVLANHVHSAADARAVLDNLASVAGHYLAVALTSAGSVAADPHMSRALALSRPIVDAFPSTVAARDFRRVAAELQHWPMRPSLATLVNPALAKAGQATSEGTREGTSEPSIAEAEPAAAGWQPGLAAQPRTLHHA